ncbi:MAG: peptide deformylase [Chloroflexi bacterium]|nr:peptide deformylase [Chloroflexota bacterium]
MAVRPILIADDPRLRRKAKRVSTVDSSIQRLINDMIDTMKAAPGVGLAATQIGVPLRIAVIQLPDEEDVFTLINPEVVKRSGEREVEEGCLSVPGYRGRLKRSLTITIKAQDRHGKAVRIKGEDLLAQALEHELDHLNGILYIDHLETPEHLWKTELPSE